jgi:NADP-dependent 3-hydroxy acid dehydrogenase YdfG
MAGRFSTSPTPVSPMTYAERWRLDGRVAVVAGAGGGGLGTACAVALAEAGAALSLVDRDPDAVAATAAQVEALGADCRVIVADLLDPEGPEAALAEA